MDREQVVQALATHLQGEFGRLLVPRAARRTRRATGLTWLVQVVAPSTKGDLPIAELEIDEDGVLVNPLDVDMVIEAIAKAFKTREEPVVAPSLGATAAADLAGLMDFSDDDEPPASSTLESDPEKIYAQAQALLRAGDGSSLQKARMMMPRLLSDPERRGAVLVWMAVIERKLKQTHLALNYLEAAAREFAERFDLPSLEKAAQIAHELVGDEQFKGSPIDALLQQCRERMRPIAHMFECPLFFPATPDERDWIGDNTAIRSLEEGDVLVREGDPSRTVFIIKSGLVGVYLEKPEGGQRLVRCCFPGWLLGESSVLVEGDPRCTATLRAEQPCEVWAIEAPMLKDVMKENANLWDRIAAAKQLHRIDSFFSMHESLGQLESSVRDELLGCIQRIQSFDQDTVVIEADLPPKVACLVARGEIDVYQGNGREKKLAELTTDRFFGVRDAMHQIASSTSAVARAGSTIAFFEADLLRALGARSPENVVAVLERLG